VSKKYRDFGGFLESSKEPISFKLYDEEFHCKGALQGKVLLDMVAISNSEDPAQNAALIDSFFGKVVLPESYERFQKLLQDEEKIVTIDTLGEITSWLVEQYSSRPTTGPEPSLSGQ
jgi:hypothetical protein